MENYQTTIFKSYGSVMKRYILIPEELLEKAETIESYDYVMTLEPK